MKKILLSALLFIFAAFCLNAQNAAEEDLDLKYAVDLLVPGTAAPDFELSDINGSPIRISDFRGRKVVLVFWASWCPDCRAEVPLLNKLQASVNASEVAFVSISFDRTFEAFKEYVVNNGLGGTQLFDPAGKKDSAVCAAYHVKWIPSLYVIDADGKVLLGTVVADKLRPILTSKD